MPRPRKRSLFPICLSPAAAADCLMVPVAKVRQSLAMGDLIGFDAGGKRVRILVNGPGGLVEWVRSWPVAQRRRSEHHD